MPYVWILIKKHSFWRFYIHNMAKIYHSSWISSVSTMYFSAHSSSAPTAIPFVWGLPVAGKIHTDFCVIRSFSMLLSLTFHLDLDFWYVCHSHLKILGVELAELALLELNRFFCFWYPANVGWHLTWEYLCMKLNTKVDFICIFSF